MKFRAGFTLIELSLSMVFIGILSISVVLIINDTVASYRRGMTLNHINTVGMDIVDDLRSSVQNASSRSIVADCVTYYPDASSDNTIAPRNQCTSDDAFNFVSVTQKGRVKLEDGTYLAQPIPVYGAFCSGTYSYIWNSGYFVGYDGSGQRGVVGAEPATLTYWNGRSNVTIYGSKKDGRLAYSLAEVEQPFRILKVYDDKRSVCVSTVRKWNGTTFNDTYKMPTTGVANNFNIASYGALLEEPVELIMADEYSDLVLYDFEVQRPAESSTRNNAFYSASFILGTIRGGIDVLAKGKSCEAPNNYETGNFDYCAINKFSFAVQAGGE